MKDYVLGFAFNKTKTDVLLVKKERGPCVNHGKWNGIGGKVEDEIIDYAMKREFVEETGFSPEWEWRGQMFGPDWTVFIYVTTMRKARLPLCNDVGEQLIWEKISDVVDVKQRRMYAQNVPTIVQHLVTGEGDFDIWARK